MTFCRLDIDWREHVISFCRKKTGTVSLIRFGDEVAEILRSRPTAGPLFPYSLRRIETAMQRSELTASVQLLENLGGGLERVFAALAAQVLATGK